MYGTVAHMQAKPGAGPQLLALAEEEEYTQIPGLVGEYIYQLDTNPDEYYLTVIFESKEAYWANANDPAQDARFQKIRVLLVSDPEWHDGEIVHLFMSGSR